MTIDKKILEDPLKTFDYLSERVYSDQHPTSPEFLRKMRKVIKETQKRTMQYIVLGGYLKMLEADTYVIADVSRMKIVCEVEEYLKQNRLLCVLKKNKSRR